MYWRSKQLHHADDITPKVKLARFTPDLAGLNPEYFSISSHSLWGEPRYLIYNISPEYPSLFPRGNVTCQNVPFWGVTFLIHIHIKVQHPTG